MEKDLQEVAINFKGKKYVLVSDRVIYFNETYPNGCIKTEMLSSGDRIDFKATVIPDTKNIERYFTGHSQASFKDMSSFVNKTSAMENAETSAVGRALAMMGIGVVDSIASIDEINKANNTNTEEKPHKTQTNDSQVVYKEITAEEKSFIESMGGELPKETMYVDDVCNKCGAPLAVSKTTGKLYCSKKCWIAKQ